MNSVYPISHFLIDTYLVSLIWRQADFIISALSNSFVSRLGRLAMMSLSANWLLSSHPSLSSEPPSIIQLATWIMERSSLHALGSLVLDFPPFTFFFNVLSKRQFRIRNLSANTAINDIYQSTPDHSLRTVSSLSLRWLLLLWYCCCYLLVPSHCIALQCIAVRCIPSPLGNKGREAIIFSTSTPSFRPTLPQHHIFVCTLTKSTPLCIHIISALHP